jgi:hypothetical protein
MLPAWPALPLAPFEPPAPDDPAAPAVPLDPKLPLASLAPDASLVPSAPLDPLAPPLVLVPPWPPPGLFDPSPCVVLPEQDAARRIAAIASADLAVLFAAAALRAKAREAVPA